MDLGLKGKRALVTGSSSGIGVGIAQVLLEEGCDVVVHGRQVEKTQAVADSLKHLGNVKVALGDLALKDGADNAAKMALEAFGGLDILINNAGGNGTSDHVGFFNISPEEWAETHASNIISTVNMIHRITPQMKELGWGRIVQISSFAAHSNTGTIPAYTATKSALLNMTLGLAKTLKHTGITVNAVSPGIIETERLDNYFYSIAAQQGFTGPERRREAIDWLLANVMPQTVKRLGTPDDVGRMVAYVCSPAADFVSAANLRIDGGASPSSN
ncbi:MAG: 3-oxoacyl-[acyl-carrier-protein] reductase [Caulobacteraceae bacterium]|nr:3-oxoacyl-[acyl-carrier-protein] reductase [Caulobacteraceae bacterium]